MLESLEQTVAKGLRGSGDPSGRSLVNIEENTDSKLGGILYHKTIKITQPLQETCSRQLQNERVCVIFYI